MKYILILILLAGSAQAQTLKYPVRITKIIDGDTVDFKASLGFDLTFKGRCRLEHINTPELPSAKAYEAKDALGRYLSRGKLRMSVNGKDGYGRHLCTLYSKEGNLNKIMVWEGFAECYWKSKECLNW